MIGERVFHRRNQLPPHSGAGAIRTCVRGWILPGRCLMRKRIFSRSLRYHRWLPALLLSPLTTVAPAQEGRESNASTDYQLSMSQLYRTAALLRDIRQTGVRVLWRQLRGSGNRGALCREGGKGGSSTTGGRVKERGAECIFLGGRGVGYLRLS